MIKEMLEKLEQRTYQKALENLKVNAEYLGREQNGYMYYDTYLLKDKSIVRVATHAFLDDYIISMEVVESK